MHRSAHAVSSQPLASLMPPPAYTCVMFPVCMILIRYRICVINIYCRVCIGVRAVSFQQLASLILPPAYTWLISSVYDFYSRQQMYDHYLLQSMYWNKCFDFAAASFPVSVCVFFFTRRYQEISLPTRLTVAGGSKCRQEIGFPIENQYPFRNQLQCQPLASVQLQSGISFPTTAICALAVLFTLYTFCRCQGADNTYTIHTR